MPEQIMNWPPEWAAPPSNELLWHDDGSNRVLDFHGSPSRARLTLLSDGNHHMALADSLQAFVKQHPEVGDVFYVTLPPPVLLEILQAGGVRLAHLQIDLRPQAFIGPKAFIDKVAGQRRLRPPRAFARSKGQALLVSRGNPKQVQGIADLVRDDVRLFISNPRREAASFEVYSQALAELCVASGLDPVAMRTRLVDGSRNIVHGRHVHHREAPSAVANGQADAAVLYRHLALRYCRVFPERFEMIELNQSGAATPTGSTILTDYFVSALEGDQWGTRLAEFMSSAAVGEAYRFHGLEPLALQ